jgi:hypothetical protein
VPQSVTGKELIFKHLLRKVWAYFYLLEPLQLKRLQGNFKKGWASAFALATAKPRLFQMKNNNK